MVFFLWTALLKLTAKKHDEAFLPREDSFQKLLIESFAALSYSVVIYQIYTTRTMIVGGQMLDVKMSVVI